MKKRFIKQKRSQMEAFGLIFIVLLLALGIFFMVYSSMKKQKESQNLSPQNIERAQLMIDAIKQIKFQCNTSGGIKNILFDDFIQDIVSEENSLPYCDGIPPSIFFENSLITIFNVSLIQKENVSFYFQLCKLKKDKLDECIGDDYIYLDNSETPFCNKNEKISGDAGKQAYPVKNGGGTANMKLFICI